MFFFDLWWIRIERLVEIEKFLYVRSILTLRDTKVSKECFVRGSRTFRTYLVKKGLYVAHGLMN